VSPDGRKVYIGEEDDVTIHGGSIMAFAKSWKSGGGGGGGGRSLLALGYLRQSLVLVWVGPLPTRQK